MVNESLKHEEKDRKKRRRVEAINKLEQLCNSVKNYLADEKLAIHFTKAEILQMEKLKANANLLILEEKSGVTTDQEFDALSDEMIGKIDPILKRA